MSLQRVLVHTHCRAAPKLTPAQQKGWADALLRSTGGLNVPATAIQSGTERNDLGDKQSVQLAGRIYGNSLVLVSTHLVPS